MAMGSQQVRKEATAHGDLNGELGEHEDVGANDEAKAEPREAPAHLVLDACGPVDETVVEAGRRLAQRPMVGAPAHERQLCVVPVPPPVAPRRCCSFACAHAPSPLS